MATLCKNCSHALIYDPGVKKMLCTSCGSTFKAEEVESEAKKYREEERVRSRGEVYGENDEEVVEEFLENYIYTCSECGGEIVIGQSMLYAMIRDAAEAGMRSESYTYGDVVVNDDRDLVALISRAVDAQTECTEATETESFCDVILLTIALFFVACLCRLIMTAIHEHRKM